MSEQNTETPATPPEGDEAPPQVEPPTPPEPPEGEPAPEEVTPEDESGDKSDQDQGVGIAPTEAGDAGEGNPGTPFQTTEEIEADDLSKSGEVGGVQ